MLMCIFSVVNYEKEIGYEWKNLSKTPFYILNKAVNVWWQASMAIIFIFEGYKIEAGASWSPIVGIIEPKATVEVNV